MTTTLTERPTCRADTYLAVGTLANGLHVAVRPLTPADADEIDAGFQHLSQTSRFRRFLTAKPRLTSTDLQVLVGQIDQHNHLALALVWPRTSRADMILADAHAIRLRERPDTADVAVTVTDEIHGQGAGRLLIHTESRRVRWAPGTECLTASIDREPPAAPPMSARATTARTFGTCLTLARGRGPKRWTALRGREERA